ncbi:hypothetical protein NEUTE2DRAFT_134415 [Neurospora tetrasperma FGSC 2509]|nr:hypothetical protein NEUTE2DRAFT_134415 [Neurospora tetrasperma FGSC 2509]
MRFYIRIRRLLTDFNLNLLFILLIINYKEIIEDRVNNILEIKRYRSSYKGGSEEGFKNDFEEEFKKLKIIGLAIRPSLVILNKILIRAALNPLRKISGSYYKIRKGITI